MGRGAASYGRAAERATDEEGHEDEHGMAHVAGHSSLTRSSEPHQEAQRRQTGAQQVYCSHGGGAVVPSSAAKSTRVARISSPWLVAVCMQGCAREDRL